MDRAKEIERLLRANGAELIRQGNHAVWKLRSGARFAMSRTGSDRRAVENSYHDLLRLLGAEAAAPGVEAAKERAVAEPWEGVGEGAALEMDPKEGGGGAKATEAIPGAPATAPTVPAPESLKQPKGSSVEAGAWEATIAQTKGLLDSKRAHIGGLKLEIERCEDEVRRLEGFLTSLQLSADAYAEVSELLPSSAVSAPPRAAGQPKRLMSPKGLPRRVLLEVLEEMAGVAGSVPGQQVVATANTLIKAFKRRGHRTTNGALHAICFREKPEQGGEGRFEWASEVHGVRFLG